MSDEVLRNMVARMATDPAFADEVRRDPAGVAAAYGLTGEQVDQLGRLVAGALGPGPSMLDTRVSKSALFFGGGLHLEPTSLIGGDPAGPVTGQHALLCDGISDHTRAAAFHHLDTADHLASSDQLAIQCDSLKPEDQFGIQCDSLKPDDQGAGIVGPDHPAAPVSLLTGKLIAPVAQTLSIVGPDHTAGSESVAIACNGRDATDPAGFLCNGRDSIDPAGFLCNGRDATDPAGFLCDGRDATDPNALLCNGRVGQVGIDLASVVDDATKAGIEQVKPAG